MVNTFFIQKGDQQYSDSSLKGLPSYVQQQRPISSVATPQTIRSYPTPSTAGQQNKLGKLHATPVHAHTWTHCHNNYAFTYICINMCTHGLIAWDAMSHFNPQFIFTMMPHGHQYYNNTRPVLMTMSSVHACMQINYQLWMNWWFSSTRIKERRRRYAL